MSVTNRADGVGVLRRVDPSSMSLVDLRMPNPDDGHEAHFASANERSFDWAGAALADFFPGLPLTRFAQATDSTTFAVGRVSQRLLDAIGAEQKIEWLFQHAHFEPPTNVRLVRDLEYFDLSAAVASHHGQFPGGRSRIRVGALAAALDDGYSLVLDGLDLRDQAWVSLAELFERVFGCTVNINGYMSTRTQTSFGGHWDDQEVVIVQLIGQKRWRVERPIALSPLKSSHGSATSGEAVWEGTLKPGDVLYVPRGWGHLVSGVDELTFHFTITIPRINGVGVLARSLDMLGAARSVPSRSSGALPIALGGEQSGELGGEPGERLGVAYRAALSYARFLMPTRSTQSLCRLLDASLSGSWSKLGTRLRSPFPGGTVIAGRSDGEIVVGIGGSMFGVPVDLAAGTACLLDGMGHDVSRVEAGVPASLAADGVLVEQLAGVGTQR